MDQEKVIVIDFGGQYNQLVARRVRNHPSVWMWEPMVRS